MLTCRALLDAIAVAGFALAFSVYQLNISRAVLSSTDNFNEYYMETLVHESALTAMNMGINKGTQKISILLHADDIVILEN